LINRQVIGINRKSAIDPTHGNIQQIKMPPLIESITLSSTWLLEEPLDISEMELMVNHGLTARKELRHNFMITKGNGGLLGARQAHSKLTV
jgi:hypothetical protein